MKPLSNFSTAIFVCCAITKDPIPLDELRYWNVARQEAYSSRDAVLMAIGAKPKP
jgi:hypothetical protein